LQLLRYSHSQFDEYLSRLLVRLWLSLSGPPKSPTWPTGSVHSDKASRSHSDKCPHFDR
jgi:hypothetical protein